MSAEVGRGPGAWRLAATVLGGFALLAVTDACATAFTLPPPAPAAGGVGLALAAYFWSAAETLGVGLVLAAVGAALVRLVPCSARAWSGALFALAAAISYVVLGEYLGVFSQHLFDGLFARAVFVVWLAGISAGLAAAPLIPPRVVGSRESGGGVSVAMVLLAVGVLVANRLALRDDYFDAHGILAVGAALFGGGALAPWVERAARTLAAGRARLVLAALGLFAVVGLAYAPSNAVRGQLFRSNTAVAPWILATVVWRAPEPHGAAPPSSWLRDRAGAPTVPPTRPGLLPENAVVVLLTIDALRADVLTDPSSDTTLPTLARLGREGVVFTNASTPGAATETSFATVFSDRYFSELRWSDSGEGWTFHPHPITDTFPRFPELLSAHGVTTANFAGIAFLAEGFGVTRGFKEETRVLLRKTSAPASRLLAPLADRLRAPGEGPLFLASHLIDTHAPYGAPRRGQSDHERYLRAVGAIDRQLAPILHLLESSFGDRWALFVSADHGEAFGEHGTTDHGKTLYEELLHVPLIARSPRFPAHTVETRVGLVDLAPTLLDLFGVETPASFEGESLVPLLAGRATTLTRPLIAEGRLRRSLTLPDGLKIIDDPRRKLVEVYDLSKDPGETVNLFDIDPARSDAALAELRAFFAAHAWREEGYSAPYKP